MARFSPTFLSWCALALTAFALAGCGAVEQARKAAQQAQSSNKMKMMGLALHSYHDTYKAGPPNWDEFIAHARSIDPESAAALAELRGAGVVFFCDVKFADALGGMANSIFAYEPGVPQNGGMVLLLDGAAMQMTAADFNAMLAAQQKDSPETVAKRSS